MRGGQLAPIIDQSKVHAEKVMTSYRIKGLAAVATVLFVSIAAQPTTARAQVAATSSTRLYADSKLISSDRISVEIVGTGPDVVLIPGLASSRETWRHTADRLRAHYRLHLVQIDGFAGEAAQANASGPVFDPAVEAISAYLGKFGHAVPLVGHSLGGTLGLAIAERHPGLIVKLMLVDTLPYYGVVFAGPSATPDTVRPMALAMKGQMSGRMPEAMAKRMAAQMVTAPDDMARIVGWMNASDPAVVGTAMTDDMLADLRPGLCSVRIPVTVLYETALSSLVKTGYAALPAGTLVEVPNAKHFLMYDQPAAFDVALDRFLAAKP
jgi:pimeloyl-[acyl-carrier protein] methyl ester esterase